MAHDSVLAWLLGPRLLHEAQRYERWDWLRYPRYYFYDVLVGLDFTTALGHGRDSRMRDALAVLAAKRLRDGRWKLDHTNGNLVVEPRGKPSKVITFLARRVAAHVGGEWHRRIEGDLRPYAPTGGTEPPSRPLGFSSRANI